MKLELRINKQLANLSIMNTKLRHYHWYVSGVSFYGLHLKFEELMDYLMELYDEIAERLLMVGGQPVASLKFYLENSVIEEATGNETVNQMVENTIAGFKLIIAEFKEIREIAEASGDVETGDIATSAIKGLDKHIWMLGATLK